MVITFNQKEYQKLNDKSYQLEKRRLQIELLKLQEDVIRNKRRICIVLEGRDTAGKSSAYKFFTQYLIPKNFKYVNLGIPSKWESSHWFQRWKKVIPKKGEIAFLDRSWYTRALTEPVMGYCSENQYRDFMNRVIPWEQSLINDGVEIVKFYFSLSQDQQKRRMKARKHSELKYWKLSPNDERIVTKWDAFTLYKEQMFKQTSTKICPWIVIDSSNKRLARVTAMHYLLNSTEYENKKVLKPKKWSKEIKSYSYSYQGEVFDGLTYNQYKILSENLG